jgi:prepilin-type N-terminal cleavage/methylation domain-containing protein
MAVMRNLRRSTVQNEIPARRGDYGGSPTGRDLCRRDAGFSMVELCITLVLLGIVAAIAFPSFRGWVDNSNLKAAARMVSSDVYDTRGRALAESRTYTITYSPDPTNTCRIQAPAVGAPANLAAVDETKNFNEYSGVRMTSASAATITIQSRGTASGGTIVLTNARGSQGNITVVITGRAHVTYSMQ